jgi:hypothetical protein
MNTDDFVAVARPRDEISANLIKAALEDAGIPAVVQGLHSSVWDGIFVPSEGSWGDVLVAKKDAEQALAVLEDYAKAEVDEDKEHQDE